MTFEETKKMLAAINSLYPNWKVDNPKATVEAWHWALEEYPAPSVKAALQIYVKTNNTGFAPSVSQIIGCLHEPKEHDRLTEGEAWALVKKAIQDGNYHAEERFNELPEIIQRAVGGAGMIRQWAQTDTDEVNSVIMSNFQRSYKAMIEKQNFNDKVSPQLSNLLKDLSEKVSGENLIENHG